MSSNVEIFRSCISMLLGVLIGTIIGYITGERSARKEREKERAKREFVSTFTAALADEHERGDMVAVRLIEEILEAGGAKPLRGEKSPYRFYIPEKEMAHRAAALISPPPRGPSLKGDRR